MTVSKAKTINTTVITVLFSILLIYGALIFFALMMHE